jgi:hypothetical protein
MINEGNAFGETEKLKAKTLPQRAQRATEKRNLTTKKMITN